MGRRVFLYLLSFLSLSSSLLCVPRLVHAQDSEKECAPPKSLVSQLNTKPSAATLDALGSDYANRKEYGCAAVAFRDSLKLDPQSPATHYFLGIALLAQGNTPEAMNEFRRSLQLNPQQTEARIALGQALGVSGHAEDAIQEFQEALKMDPKSVPARDGLAKAYMSLKRYPAAIALLKDGPQDESLEMDLVMAYSNNGENALALDLLHRMQRERPDSALPHFGMGSVYTQQRRYEDATKEFQEALQLNPADDNSRAAYIRVLLMQGKLDTALPIAEEYQQRHPNEFDSCYLLGEVERQLVEYTQAKPFLEQAVKVKPEDYFARYSLGLVYAKTGETSKARVQLEKAVAIDPSSPEAHFQLASVLRSLSLNDEALGQLNLYQNLTASRSEKDVAEAKANQARALLNKGDAKGAVELYREAIERDSADARLYFDFAIALESAGDREEALKAFSKSLNLDPKFAPAHNQLGLLYAQAGQTPQAEHEFQAAISLDPEEVQAYNNLGVLYGQQGRYDEAAKLFKTAIAHDPSYAPSYVNLAVAEASRSQFSEAESALKKALQIEPDNAETRALLSQVQSHLGQPNDAHP